MALLNGILSRSTTSLVEVVTPIFQALYNRRSEYSLILARLSVSVNAFPTWTRELDAASIRFPDSLSMGRWKSLVAQHSAPWSIDRQSIEKRLSKRSVVSNFSMGETVYESASVRCYIVVDEEWVADLSHNHLSSLGGVLKSPLGLTVADAVADVLVTHLDDEGRVSCAAVDWEATQGCLSCSKQFTN